MSTLFGSVISTRAPLKIFFASTAVCASHKLICAKLRRKFRERDLAPKSHAEKIWQRLRLGVLVGDDRIAIDDRTEDGCLRTAASAADAWSFATAELDLRFRRDDDLSRPRRFAAAETTPAANAAGVDHAGAAAPKRLQ